jgi:hypothetical protein
MTGGGGSVLLLLLLLLTPAPTLGATEASAMPAEEEAPGALIEPCGAVGSCWCGSSNCGRSRPPLLLSPPAPAENDLAAAGAAPADDDREPSASPLLLLLLTDDPATPAAGSTGATVASGGATIGGGGGGGGGGGWTMTRIASRWSKTRTRTGCFRALTRATTCVVLVAPTAAGAVFMGLEAWPLLLPPPRDGECEGDEEDEGEAADEKGFFFLAGGGTGGASGLWKSWITGSS